jgi:hypothetical protein
MDYENIGKRKSNKPKNKEEFEIKLGNKDGTLNKTFRENKGNSKQDRNRGW